MNNHSSQSHGAGELLLDELNEICALSSGKSWRAQERIKLLSSRARAEFAHVNGWHVAKTRFSFHDLVTQTRRRPCPACRHRCLPQQLHVNGSLNPYLDDHPEHFRAPERPYRPVGIAAHLYANDDMVEKAREWAERHDLVLHEPPNLHASWYLPGNTRLVVYTRPGRELEWPSFAK